MATYFLVFDHFDEVTSLCGSQSMYRLSPMTDLADTTPDLGELVVSLSRRLRRARIEALEPYGLPPHHARAFMIVARHCTERDCSHGHQDAELRPSDLAARLHIAPRSATEVIDALQERGLVFRQPSATDRRATTLHITDQGRALSQQLRRAQGEQSGQFAALDAAEREQLAVLLRKALDQG